jgi:hypothetical protein
MCVCVCVCVSNKLQQCTVYILYFTAKLLYMFRVSFTPIIRGTGNCSRRPLVQVICRNRLEGAASNPLKSIHSQATTTLHHSQIKTFQPIASYDLYQWSMTTVSCTPDNGCKRHPKHIE